MNFVYFARRAIFPVVFFVVSALLLGACGTIETDLTLRTNERFDAISQITVPVAVLALAGGAEAIESQFREIEQQAVVEGVEFSWGKERSGNADEVVYRISLSGTGYAALADTFGIQIESTQYDGKEALHVYAGPNYDLSEMEHTIRLHVGRILQTNNQRVDNNTIVWTGMETLEAIVTPASETGGLTVLLVSLVTVMVIVLAILLLRQRLVGRAATTTVPTEIARYGGVCPHCGQPTPPGTRFCMYCGNPLPGQG